MHAWRNAARGSGACPSGPPISLPSRVLFLSLSPVQLDMVITRRTKLFGSAFGVAIGCLIGMAPLLFMEDRKQVYFNDDELSLFETVFAPHGVSAQQFFALVHFARWHNEEAGTVLVRQGDVLDRVFLIHTGCAKATEKTEGGTIDRFFYAGRNTPYERKDVPDGVPVRNIIGGTSLIGDCADLSGTPYPNEVALTEYSTYVEWPIAELRDAMRDDKTVEAAMMSLLYRQIIGEHREQLEQQSKKSHASTLNRTTSSRYDEYKTMLQVVVADGFVHPKEKDLLDTFALRHGITADQHNRLLKALGWSAKEWNEGVKRDLQLEYRGLSSTLQRNMSRRPDDF